MIDERTSAPRIWSPPYKGLIAGALAGGLLTVGTYFAAVIASGPGQGSKFYGFDIWMPMCICFLPSALLVDTLRLPLDYWGGNLYIPGKSGLIFCALVNALFASAVGTVLGWFWSKLRKPKSI